MQGTSQQSNLQSTHLFGAVTAQDAVAVAGALQKVVDDAPRLRCMMRRTLRCMMRLRLREAPTSLIT